MFKICVCDREGGGGVCVIRRVWKHIYHHADNSWIILVSFPFFYIFLFL